MTLNRFNTANGHEGMTELDILKEQLRQRYRDESVPMKRVKFTRENFNQNFPDNKVQTPLGEVNIGAHQYEKLDANSRRKYIGGMHQTLNDPVVVINQEDERGKSQLFTKSFTHKPKKKDGFVSVVTNIDGKNVSISSHPKFLRKVIENIKNATDVAYIKPNSGGTAGADSVNRAIFGNPQLPINITQSDPVVNRENIAEQNREALVKGGDIAELNSKMAKLQRLLRAS